MEFSAGPLASNTSTSWGMTLSKNVPPAAAMPCWTACLRSASAADAFRIEEARTFLRVIDNATPKSFALIDTMDEFVVPAFAATVTEAATVVTANVEGGDVVAVVVSVVVTVVAAVVAVAVVAKVVVVLVEVVAVVAVAVAVAVEVVFVTVVAAVTVVVVVAVVVVLETVVAVVTVVIVTLVTVVPVAVVVVLTVVVVIVVEAGIVVTVVTRVVTAALAVSVVVITVDLVDAIAAIMGVVAWAVGTSHLTSRFSLHHNFFMGDQYCEHSANLSVQSNGCPLHGRLSYCSHHTFFAADHVMVQVSNPTWQSNFACRAAAGKTPAAGGDSAAVGRGAHPGVPWSTNPGM
mmetsp:Transcript_137520/g.383543  ORF Transcript_137520/g.383543 Transcript_137520/m.383543 type:complete len:347 (+) Transcript_137520:2399-3439(+)